MSSTSSWKETAIYHIYPRSFQDTDGDGIGDLPGITRRLGHIRDLGAGAIWMGPVFPSPQVDYGYDISDYRDIDPLFGTLDDMEALIDRAHDLGLKVLLDLVLNHTSDRHPWFREALKEPDGPYGDYYFFRDPAAGGGPPNNWRSFFSIPAWTFVEERRQYYLHLFAPEQPDLNWDNPAVREEMSGIANFWLAKGVDGFRLDVINMISKIPGLPSLVDGRRSGVFIDGPKILEYLQEFRRSLKTDKALVLVGETPGVTPEAARAYTDPANRALDMVLLFDHLEVDHGPSGRWEPRVWSVADLAGVVSRWQDQLSAPSWPSIYLSNHDQPRVVSRYGNDADYRFQSATALATVFYLQRGTPIVYQGEEIGMKNFPLESPNQILDIETKNAYLDLVGAKGLSEGEAMERIRREARDNSRTPMQWSDAKNAGFSDAKPWYPPNPDFRRWNVAAQQADPKSVLAYYRELLSFRQRTPALIYGDYEHVAPAPDSKGTVFAFRRRRMPSDRLLVAANLSDAPATWRLPEEESRSLPTLRLLFGNYAAPTAGTGTLALRPWEAVVLA
ncbi:MAG: alpha-glucosidase [Spirochaetota bacterium]